MKLVKESNDRIEGGKTLGILISTKKKKRGIKVRY